VIEPVWVWGVPFAPMTLGEAVEAVDALIESRRPSYFITANLHYLMLSSENADLAAVNERAAFILADGAPVVWAARTRSKPLPERVAGSDLIFHLCDLSARKGRRLFFLGAPEGVAEEAAEKLRARYPDIQIVGTECPPYRKPTEEEHDQLLARIRAANPDVLFVAFGQPKGERWIFENLERLNIPVCVQVGASLEFAAGRFARAPRWMQRTGLEWGFRLLQEPRRLFLRYARNARFMGRMIVQDRIRKPDSSRIARTASSVVVEPPRRHG
jgi:N-acetylglucosaminyldiphosphoundecaprenol N-acetyl-beta-D-mannosaminyltransferase